MLADEGAIVTPAASASKSRVARALAGAVDGRGRRTLGDGDNNTGAGASRSSAAGGSGNAGGESATTEQTLGDCITKLHSDRAVNACVAAPACVSDVSSDAAAVSEAGVDA